MMSRQRMILGLATLAVVGAGAWAWYGNSASPETTPAQSAALSPFRKVDPATVASAQSAPEVTPAPQAAVDPTPAASDESAPIAAPVNAEPRSVDTPEPAQQKFAHGSHVEPEQI